MTPRMFTLSTEQISKETALYSIGFVTVSFKGTVEEAVCAGSGTLVTIGPLFGILTAAHVIEALPKTGEVGLVVGIEDPSKFQRQTILMEHTDSVVMPGVRSPEVGPDLGFLRLPEETIGWLKAQRSFYNLLRRQEDVLANKEPTRSHADVVIGMIHELTADVPSDKPFVRRQQFTALFGGAKLGVMRYLNGYDIFYYEPAKDFGFELPNSFHGTSGGAIWRFYVEETRHHPKMTRVIGPQPSDELATLPPGHVGELGHGTLLRLTPVRDCSLFVLQVKGCQSVERCRAAAAFRRPGRSSRTGSRSLSWTVPGRPSRTSISRMSHSGKCPCGG
jgi:hypothetical protein